MKILFYFGGFAPVGGIETFCKNLLCYLQTQYECQIVCWGQQSPMLRAIESAAVKVTRIPFRWGCRWNLPDWLLLPIGLQHVQQADVILLGKLFPLDILRKLKFKAKKTAKLVYITPYRPTIPTTLAEQKQLIETLNLFNIILVQASTFKADLQQAGYQGQVEVIPYIPQGSHALKAFPSQDQLNIGFLGRLVDDKNVPLLLKSFYSFQKEYGEAVQAEPNKPRKAVLHLFGDGCLRKSLEQLTEELHLSENVVFHGNVPNDQVAEAIASCHLFAFTSRTEGQCLAALEILSCGRPIVATNVGALPDILSDTRLGRVIESNSASDFAYQLLKIAQCIEDGSCSPEEIQAAYLEQYDAEQIGDRYSKILREIFLL